MRFGLPKRNFLSHWGILFIAIALVSSCNDSKINYITFKSPEQGQNFNIGDEISVQLDLPDGVAIDKFEYLIDGKSLGTVSGAKPITIATKDMKLGYRMLTGIIYNGDKRDTVSTNIVLKSNKIPVPLTYSLINTFPHDTSAYTEGLSYVDGTLLESTGEKGASLLKLVDLTSGKTLKKTRLAPQYFGEGSVKVNDKIIMLTWQENIGFVFDAKSFKQIGTFPYQSSKEGWGLTFDGQHILRSDGTNRIWRMNAKTFAEEDYIEVYDQNGPVNNINELEYINDKIYANVYLTNKIIIINPFSGVVEAQIDLSALVPKNYFKTTDEEQNNVLNGIAWDEKGKRLFVTGKKWPKLYEIKVLAN